MSYLQKKKVETTSEDEDGKDGEDSEGEEVVSHA
jgi:hypothetical protein